MCKCSGCILKRYWDLRIRPRPPKPRTVRGYGCDCPRCVHIKVRQQIKLERRAAA